MSDCDGFRKLNMSNENLGAVHVQLTPADLREMQTARAKITVHGERMSEQHMQSTAVSD